MILLMAISLYTSRVILNVLGVTDFGIYNVVGGVVMMVGFVNSPLNGTTRYFIGTGILFLHAFMIHWRFKKYQSINILSFVNGLIKNEHSI